MSKKVWIFIIVVLAVILAVLLVIVFKQQDRMNTIEELAQIEKESAEDELSELSMQYEGMKINVSNDSLLSQLDTERMKVARLQEELRTVKTTNYKRIKELTKEIATLRSVMRTFVIQIDSLNRQNERLNKENTTIKRKYNEATQVASQLKKEKATLTEQVTLASQLDAVSISAIAINKRGKETDKISKTEQLKFTFTITKNITAEPGEKYIYLRILKPDDDILVKDRSAVFKFEDKEINYSIRKLIEYAGEEIQITMYWKVEEFLYPGTYRVDIFADNNLIGKKSFTLEK